MGKTSSREAWSCEAGRGESTHAFGTWTVLQKENDRDNTAVEIRTGKSSRRDDWSPKLAPRFIRVRDGRWRAAGISNAAMRSSLAQLPVPPAHDLQVGEGGLVGSLLTVVVLV